MGKADFNFYLIYYIVILQNVEPWEELKCEADMEYYDWNTNTSKTSIQALFGKPVEEIPKVNEYSTAVTNLMNEGIIFCFFLIC